MKIRDIIDHLEFVAPPVLQESYDNAGLITGDNNAECTGAIISLDATEAVIKEAIDKKCNLVIAHHPIVFRGLKKITGKDYVEKTILLAIKNDIAIYAIHTNLDNIITGVNGKIADKLNLINREILGPKNNILRKLYVFVPPDDAEKLRSAIFKAGGGYISNYSECSFNMEGEGTFKPGEGSHPETGEIGKRHTGKEIKVEIIFPFWLQKDILKAMFANHPYEEVAYDVISLENHYQETGSGIIGELEKPVDEMTFLKNLKTVFGTGVVKHTSSTGKTVKKVAICGGAGSFLTSSALKLGADVFVTADVKYHEFFDANDQMVIADIGHFESEQFTIDLLYDIIREKFPTFAVQKTGVKTNPVRYL